MAASDPPRANRRVVLAAYAVHVVTMQAGRALMPPLLVHAPLLLVGLSPIPVHLLAVAPESHPVAFVGVVTLRRLLGAVCGYHLGLVFGRDALTWLEGRSGGTGRALRFVLRHFKRAPHLMVVLMPNVGTPLLSGTARLPLPGFIVANLLGQLWIAIGFFLVGDALRDLILPAVAYVADHMLLFTVASVGLVALTQLVRRLRGQGRGALPGAPEDGAP